MKQAIARFLLERKHQWLDHIVIYVAGQVSQPSLALVGGDIRRIALIVITSLITEVSR